MITSVITIPITQPKNIPMHKLIMLVISITAYDLKISAEVIIAVFTYMSLKTLNITKRTFDLYCEHKMFFCKFCLEQITA